MFHYHIHILFLYNNNIVKKYYDNPLSTFSQKHCQEFAGFFASCNQCKRASIMEEKSPLKRALDLSTNKIVSAFAGAGKTFALSKRYCKIIDEFTKENLQKPKSK